MSTYLLFIAHTNDDIPCIERTSAVPIHTVSITHTGKRRRPSKDLDVEYLKEAMSSSRKITITRLAKLSNIHRNTLSRKLRLKNVENKFSDLSEADLDVLAKRFKSKRPESGINYLIGFLRQRGLRVQ